MKYAIFVTYNQLNAGSRDCLQRATKKSAIRLADKLIGFQEVESVEVSTWRSNKLIYKVPINNLPRQ